MVLKLSQNQIKARKKIDLDESFRVPNRSWPLFVVLVDPQLQNGRFN
jgi:hypothetical protein